MTETPQDTQLAADAGPTPAPEFDLEAWLAGARPPTGHQRVIGAGHLLGEYEHLSAQLEDLRTPGSRVTRPGMFVGAGPSEAEIAARMTRIRAEIDASIIDLRFQALDIEQQKACDDAARKPDGSLDGGERAARWVAAACVSHRMTPEHARQMRRSIGESQFWQCWHTVDRLTTEHVTVPFSLAHSAREG